MDYTSITPSHLQHSPLVRFTAALNRWATRFAEHRLCRNNARIMADLPPSVQKDIGWRHHCETDSLREINTFPVMLKGIDRS